MAKKLLIILVNSNPDNPEALGAPFFQATVAAAMDYDVEILMTGRAGELAKKGIAQTIKIQESSVHTVYDFIKDAVDAGVILKVCTPTIEIWGDELIPEIRETVGGGYAITEAMSDDTVTFTY
ncbi:MAG: DsrE family protein [Gammaproteobacteria bacterium]|nr:DsrE family protein [Gammaproteobacteria bacterium]